MLAIRLARVGAKKKPAYRVVVTEKSRARDSSSLEIVGHYNPTKDPIILSLKEDRIEYWISKGAQPSKTVSRLMKYEAPPPPAVEEKPAPKPEKAAEPAAEAAAEASAAVDPAEAPVEAAAEAPAETPAEEPDAAASDAEPAAADEAPAAADVGGGETPQAAAEAPAAAEAAKSGAQAESSDESKPEGE